MQVFTDLVVDKLFSFTMAKLMMYTPILHRNKSYKSCLSALSNPMKDPRL